MEKHVYNDTTVKQVAANVCAKMYASNLQATKELMQLLDCVMKENIPRTPENYIRAYDGSFFTYKTFKELVNDERESDGLTEKECREQLGKTIWQLSCGWFVQYV